MGLINKLKTILFDEEVVDIPVITKEDRMKSKEAEKKPKKTNKSDDEVIIHQIETPKHDGRVKDDDFDMPKLVEEEKKETPTKTFTFPVFDDEEVPSREKSKPVVKEEKTTRHETRRERTSGYTNAYDYSYGKYNGDYKSSKAATQSKLTQVLEEKEEKKAFTPSPIISPVYGVLNENYKKEDLIPASEKKPNSSVALDIDSVRKKAYGTLEEELESSLSKENEEIEIPRETKILEDEGISINDLLVDEAPIEENEPVIEDMEATTELFNVLDEAEEITEEIDFDDEEKQVPKETPKVPKKEVVTPEVKEVKEEKTEDKKEEENGEEDLFDLIDSIYEGKNED